MARVARTPMHRRQLRCAPCAVASATAPARRPLGGGAPPARPTPPPSAAVSLWLDCYDARGPYEALLREDAIRLDGYLVTESVPQACPDRDWPDGSRSPGVSHFTWFQKPAGLAGEGFFPAWHQGDPPL